MQSVGGMPHPTLTLSLTFLQISESNDLRPPTSIPITPETARRFPVHTASAEKYLGTILCLFQD